MILLGLLWACQEPPHGPSEGVRTADTSTSAGVTLTGVSASIGPAPGTAWLTAEVVASAAEPTRLTVVVDDPCGTRELVFPEADVHTVPLLGLHADAVHHVRVVLEGVSGRAEVDLGEWATDAPLLPPLEVAALDPDALEPGLLVVPLRSEPEGGPGWLLVYDDHLHLVYALRVPIQLPAQGDDGSWWVLDLDGGVTHYDPLGRPLSSWPESVHPHHELQLLPDGDLLTLVPEEVRVDRYPVDPALSAYAPADIKSQAVAVFSPEGEERLRAGLAAVLDTSRVSPLSFDGSNDWSHANAAVPWGDDAWLVSVRHLDVVACIGHDGALRWLFGDPTGWTSPWAERFLRPTGEVRWPRHQHAVQALPDGFAVFDNGNYGGSLYAPTPPGWVKESRSAAYRVDEEAGTVTQRWSFGFDGAFTGAMGSAFVQPVTGHVLFDFGFSFNPRGARVVEVDPSAPEVPLMDVFVPGVTFYRVFRVGSLYPEGVETRR